MEDSVIVIGGVKRDKDSLLEVYRKVIEYDDDGWVAEYPSLQTGRANSACGYYYSNDRLVNF